MSNGSSFVYVIYIRTTPEKLWRALTEPEFTRQYWAQCWQEFEWKQGAAWKIMKPDGEVADSARSSRSSRTSGWSFPGAITSAPN